MRRREYATMGAGRAHMTTGHGRPRPRALRVGLVQARASADPERNLAETARRIRKAADLDADIVCLQELFAGPYFARTEDPAHHARAEPVPGPTSRFLARAAADCGVVLVGGSIYERASNGKRYNTTLVFDGTGKRVGKYRKVHIPHDACYYERYYFDPGDLGYVQVRTPGATIAPLICYDQWFPEAARVNALHGAQVLFYPTAIGWFPEFRREEPFSAGRWEDAMRSHASMNGVFVVAVNRVGREGDLKFWGGSFVADPFGQVVARASRTRAQVLVADLDLDMVDRSRNGWGFLANRRPETYGDLTR